MVRSELRGRGWVAVAAWSVALAIAALLLVSGRLIADCWHVYSMAARHWATRTPLYDLRSIDDFQYFPQSAIAAVPIAWLGQPWSGVVWRALGWGLLANGVWRASGLAWAAPPRDVFLATTVLVIPPAMTSLLNGQANLHIAALMMQAVVDLHDDHRWRVTLWLTIGMALKPIVLVMLLLTCVFEPSMIWRLALSVGMLAVFPFGLAPAGYVASQYRDCAHKLMMSAQPDRFFEDLRGLAWRLGWLIPYPLLRAIAGVAAIAVAVACRHVRRVCGARDGSLLVFALAAAYLMLFNSRNQPNSYVIIAPAAALPAALFALRRQWPAAATLSLMVVCWCGSAIRPTEYWLKPLTCIVFSGVLARAIILEERRGMRLLQA